MQGGGCLCPYFNPLWGFSLFCYFLGWGGKEKEKDFSLMLWWLFFFFWVEKKGLNQGHDLLLADCWTFGGSNVTRADGHWPPLLSIVTQKWGKKRKKEKNLFCTHTERGKDFVKKVSFYDLALLIVLKRRSCVKKYQPLTFFLLVNTKKLSSVAVGFSKGRIWRHVVRGWSLVWAV